MRSIGRLDETSRHSLSYRTRLHKAPPAGTAPRVGSIGRGVVPSLAITEHDAARRELYNHGPRGVDTISDVE